MKHLLPLLLCITGFAGNWTNYPSVTAPTSTYTLLIGGGGTNQQITAGNFLTWVNTNSGPITSSGTVTATNFVLSAPYNWVDSMVPAMSLRTGATAPPFAALSATNAQFVLKFATGDEGHGTAQINHDWVEGTPIEVHCHWTGDAVPSAPNTNVVWGLDWSFTEIGGSILAHGTRLATNGVAGKQMHQLTDFGMVTNSAAKLSSILLFRVYRVAAGDTYPGAACLLGVDAHYQVNSLGSSAQIVK